MGRGSTAVWVGAGCWDLCTLLQGHVGDPGPACPWSVSWIPYTTPWMKYSQWPFCPWQ